jgi:hypothetical protein
MKRKLLRLGSVLIFPFVVLRAAIVRNRAGASLGGVIGRGHRSWME